MKLLLDTHLLLWAAGHPDRLSAAARALIEDQHNDLLFSAASLWEVAIKRMLDRPDFQVDPRLLRRGLLDNGYIELGLTSEHAVSIDRLPDLHRDPFDRILVAQALVEGLTLVTADDKLDGYPGSILKV
ncbi:type II toxin-antitoxin system VapC family toxin [Sphingomonas sp. MMS24-J13]|uniref:type II toxin-antitoxin system VapC family toxin n=1 Tax=Sphingomonas sp. MMS24-J13 TaxID=3238686 RepID=UPI00384B81E4